jgi:hypothetical protein
LLWSLGVMILLVLCGKLVLSDMGFMLDSANRVLQRLRMLNYGIRKIGHLITKVYFMSLSNVIPMKLPFLLS